MELAFDGSPIVTLPPDLRSEIEVLAKPGKLWHLPEEVFDLLWPLEDGAYSTVAVLDTGMNSHDDLPEPIAAKSFIPGENWRDGNGHGTHCAGTVLGRNGLGLAPAAKLIVGKVLSNSGSGSSQAIADGITWAVDAGADVISMSLGSGSPYTPMEDAIKYAWSKGVLVVSAAGNSGFNGSQNTIGYPAKYLVSLCIGAYRKDYERASFSSGGRELDICCPGQDIVSASTTNGYRTMSGTSMATPYSAGMFALLISRMKREGYTSFKSPEEVRTLLQENALDKGTPGRDPYWGWGIPQPLPLIKKFINNDIKWV